MLENFRTCYENVTSAIKDSCNYFFYNVGYQLATRTGSYNEEAGLDTLANMRICMD